MTKYKIRITKPGHQGTDNGVIDYAYSSFTAAELAIHSRIHACSLIFPGEYWSLEDFEVISVEEGK